MDSKEFKLIVAKVKAEHPVWFGLESDSRANDAVVKAAESQLRCKLPRDYVEFVSEYGGGYFAFSNIYSLEDGSDWNLVEINNKYEHLRDGHILISENGVGDFYGFKSDIDSSSRLYFYDHEEDVWLDSEFGNLYDYLCKYALKM